MARQMRFGETARAPSSASRVVASPSTQTILRYADAAVDLRHLLRMMPRSIGLTTGTTAASGLIFLDLVADLRPVSVDELEPAPDSGMDLAAGAGCGIT